MTLVIICFLLIVLSYLIVTEGDFSLSIIHYNDFHTRYTPIDWSGKECSGLDIEKQLCYGGFARLKAKIDQLRRDNDNSIVLSVGDFSQGTLWNTIYNWSVAGHFLNQLNHTAFALGIHEFDFGPDILVKYMDILNAPIVCANMDISKFPKMQNKFQKSIVVNVGGQKVGFIGYISPDVKLHSSPGTVDFVEEVESIASEASRLKREGVNIIVAMGTSGYPFDRDKIAHIPEIDVVVGGRSHSFLYSGKSNPSTEKPVGPYPTIVRRDDSSIALVVQAYCYGKYLGFLKVTFDNGGNVKSWNGKPILLDNSAPEDARSLVEIASWKVNLTVALSQPVGQTHVYLDGRNEVCRRRECNFGNIITDAMVYFALDYANDFQWNYVSLAISNAGAISSFYDERFKNKTIDMDGLYTILPFRNTIAFVEIKGEHLKKAFEFSVSLVAELKDKHASPPDGRFLQVSGFRVVFDICQPQGSRVKEILVMCNECRVPSYSPLQPGDYYKVMMPMFLVIAGDGYTVIQDNVISHQSTGRSDSEILVKYMKDRGPLITGIEGRIIILGENECSTNDAGFVLCRHVTTFLMFHFAILIGILELIP